MSSRDSDDAHYAIDDVDLSLLANSSPWQPMNPPAAGVGLATSTQHRVLPRTRSDQCPCRGR